MRPGPARSAARTMGLGWIVMLFAACQGGALPSPSARLAPAAPSALAPSGAPAGSAPAAAGSSPRPAIPAEPLVRIEPDGLSRVIRAEDGPAGSAYVLPAAGARASDGSLILLVAWFGTAGPLGLTTARSDDGSAWEVGPFVEIDLDAPDPGAVPTALLALPDGSWQLYGWAPANTSGTAFRSWRATAASPAGPWSVDAPDLLPPGPVGSWDSSAATVGSVVRSRSEYLLYYEGEMPGRTNRGDIGLAVSHDGLAPEKLAEPVIGTGICGPGTAATVEQPHVEPARDGFLGLFGAFAGAGETQEVWAALSGDGRTWTCAVPRPVLTAADLGDGDGIHTIASIGLGDGRVGLLVESLGDGRSDVWWGILTATE